MRRGWWVLLGFGALVVAEIWLLVLLADKIGVGWTLLILLAEGLLGGWLLKREGPKAWAALADARNDPATLGPRLTDAALVLVGGILVMLPGFLSDLLGLVFLLPPTRSIGRRAVTAVFGAFAKNVRAKVETTYPPTTNSRVIHDDQVVEGEVIEGDVID